MAEELDKPGELLPAGKSPLNAEGFSYSWVTNENLMRDEAVLAALTRTDPSPYQELIAGYFEIRKADSLSSLSALHEKTEVLALKLNKATESLTEVEEALFRSWPRVKQQAHLFYRKLAGVIGYSAFIALNAVLAWWWLKPISDWAFFFALGGYLMGLFMLFNRDSLFLSGNQDRFPEQKPHQEKWKVWLEELGAPVVATLLIVGLGWRYHVWYQGLMIIPFLLLLFILGGKSFLSLLATLPQEFQELKENKRMRKLDESNRAEKTVLLSTLKTEVTHLEAQQTTLQQDTTTVKKDLKHLEAEAEATIRYFLSEYKLAESSLNQFGEDLLSQIKPNIYHER